jgi:DNA repair protein SbcC/Rad50
MKILTIRIKNLASLEGSTEIDFTQEPLSSAGIFAITGPTGAGKSTILDALCLALYGKTPRYFLAKESGIEITDVQGNAISQGDVRGILRDGTGEGFAEVDFAGVDGQLYRATWRVRRARDKAEGSLQSYTMALKNINTNVDIPGKKTELLLEIERLVGLNFEQFTRSVLLAQGDFTAFLKAAKNEKSSLLEKLTGTHIYSEISKQVHLHHKQEDQELTNLNLQRAGIHTLTAEELELLAGQSLAFETTIQTLEKEIEILSREIAWHVQLSALQSNLDTANMAHEQALATKQDTMVRELELKQAEQVQPARTLVDSLQLGKTQLAEKTGTLQQLLTAVHALQEQNTRLAALLQKANDAVAAKTKEQEEAKPLLEAARRLDIQIKEKTEQVTLAANEVKDIDLRYKQQEEKLQVQQLLASQLLNSIEKLKAWKEENTNRQPIAENQSIIKSKLSDAQKLLDAVQSVAPKLEAAQTDINRTKQVKIDLDTNSSAINLKLQAEKEAQAIVSGVVSAIAITTIESEKAAIDFSVEDIIGAEAQWKVLFNSQNSLAALKQKLADNNTEWSNKTPLLTQTVEQMVIVKAERDGSLRMLDKARLAAAENVESLRSQLIAGDPCPVCGSTEHPYATQHPQLDHVLQQLETAHQQYEKQYADCLATESSLREASKQLKETIGIQEQELSTKEPELQNHKATWERYSIYPDASHLPDEQKAGWLAQQLKDTRKKQKELQEQIKLYAAKKQELETLQNNVAELNRQLNENTNALKDAERSLQSLQEQWSQSHSEQEKTNSALSEIEQSLSNYFAVQDWFVQWKSNPDAFLKAISDFAEKWNANTQKLVEDTQQQDVLSATITAMQGQLQSLLAEVQKKHTTLDGLKQQQEMLMQERKAIFNGEAAATVEAALNQAVNTAQLTWEKSKADWNQLQIDIGKADTQKEQVEKDIALLQQQIGAADKKLQDWLIQFNNRNNPSLDITKLLQLLSLSPDWIDAERAALRNIEDAITQAQSVLQERTAQLQQHEQQRLSARTGEELKELLNTAKAALQQQVQEKNEIGFRLQQDDANKQKIGGLLGSIEAKSVIVENWAKLNEIIGSADGKKFRQIAQEYTLDVLLSYANVHLEMLSKRYLLQRIPNSLGLQVLDQDMGNEIRTVFSLSGGESFLVSLALALGLASLSSSRMQVESLFIDEGFGSLDPATLNIAMDALERLHNQGRKVGVISHVQEMTERIPVQIKVSKQNSGRSKVEVMGKNVC